MGAPIRSSMDVTELGRAGEFIVYQDRHAAGADAIVLVNRIKPHTDFHGPIESGLMKMAAIGLGKQRGAHQFHQATARIGHAEALVAIAREVLKLSRIAFGIAIIENQLHQTARIHAVPGVSFEQTEQQVFSPDMLVREPLSFLGRIGKHALALIAQRQIDRGRDLLPNGGMSFDLLPDRFDRGVRAQEPVGQRFILAQKPQQKVFGLDVR